MTVSNQPYGNCHAFTTFPQPEDLKASYRAGHSFFWHNLGGHSGTNPSNGADGWEDSGKGRYKDGKPDYSRMPRDHNEHYPLWAPRNSTLKRGPAGPAQRFENSRPEPCQPKCGCPCKPNRDPGCAPGAYGSYHPAPALEYFAPKDWEGDCNDNDLK
ncbi:hypothetical protein PSHT_07219 [Puccinia striiformis]|uniref:Uncharacterized protein n=2 Tax=Puccinia striiformis TaxID=27350 RepID=A0A2S4VTQ1_9BASI|nr:hypothetical protein PSTT_04101 [Puccinia striiformis]POW15043.1 hypothetical protein PSHT_07219 [Puccinia striiformis]